jgi:hypothetical protein
MTAITAVTLAGGFTYRAWLAAKLATSPPTKNALLPASPVTAAERTDLCVPQSLATCRGLLHG